MMAAPFDYKGKIATFGRCILSGISLNLTQRLQKRFDLSGYLFTFS